VTAAEARPEGSKAGERVGRMRTTPVGLPSLIDIETLAVSLGISIRHVRRLVAERRIPYVKVGHLIRFDRADVARWVLEHRVEVFDRSSVRRRRGS